MLTHFAGELFMKDLLCIKGKIELTFEKVVPELWSNFGIFERTRSRDETLFNEYSVVTSDSFNSDSFYLILRPKIQQLVVVPIGYHFNIKLKLFGE